MKQTKSLRIFKLDSNQLIKDVDLLITELEQLRDNERNLNLAELQFLKILYIVHNFLAKSDLLKNDPDNYRHNEYKYFISKDTSIDNILQKIKDKYSKIDETKII